METKTKILTFSIDEILDQVKLRLEYFAGKRAKLPEEFFRYSVCEADIPIMVDLSRKAFLWLCSRLGLLSLGAEWNQDSFSLTLLYPPQNVEESTWSLIRDTFRFVVADRIIRLWLDLTGHRNTSQPTGSYLDSLLTDSDDSLTLLADTLSSLLRRRSPLAPRPIMPI